MKKIKKTDELNKELFEQLTSKNPLETAYILASEFVRLFGSNWGTSTDISKKLLPRGKASSWGTLDKNINVFCKQFYETWETDQDKIDFFDEARFFIGSLSIKQDYKLPEHNKILLSPELASHYFTTCSLCWRSVLQKPLEKKTPLCHIHDLPSTSPEYRKRMRMKKRVEASKLQLLKSLLPLTHAKFEHKYVLDNYVKSLCTLEGTQLQYLQSYLQSLQKPLNSNLEILQALEHPIYSNKLSNFILQTWDYYLQDRAEHFKLTYLQLISAEAWLKTDMEHKHGGKRR